MDQLACLRGYDVQKVLGDGCTAVTEREVTSVDLALRQSCQSNDQRIDNQICLTNRTKIPPVHPLQQTHMVRYCTYLVSTGVTRG